MSGSTFGTNPSSVAQGHGEGSACLSLCCGADLGQGGQTDPARSNALASSPWHMKEMQPREPWAIYLGKWWWVQGDQHLCLDPSVPQPQKETPSPWHMIHTLWLAKREWVHITGDDLRREQLFL